MASTENCFYRFKFLAELHMKPAKNRKVKIFIPTSDINIQSSLHYGTIPENPVETDIIESFENATGYGIIKTLDENGDIFLTTGDKESITSKDQFVKVVHKGIPEKVTDIDNISLINLIRELPKDEFFKYLKDKLSEIEN